MRQKNHLLLRLAVGIAAGMVLGLCGEWFGIANTGVFIGFVRLFKTFNDLFSTFLSFLIPLIILSFVAVGLADLGKKANKLFGVTLALAYASTLAAGFCAFFAGRAVLPGLVSAVEGTAAQGAQFTPFFTLEIPPVFGVMTALALSFLLGIGMANVAGGTLLSAIKNLKDIVAATLEKVVIPLIPVHIAGLFLTIAAQGELLPTIKTFAFLFVLILVLQAAFLFVQYGFASAVTKRSQFQKMKNALPAYLTALGTQSSAAAIPVALGCAYENGVDKDVADFCIPLCATIHLAGDTIALVVGSMGILLANGMQPEFLQFAPFIFMLGITMVAAPGVPGGGVMAALGLITSMLGFDASMQNLIIALHVSQDSFGTATNVTGDQALALVADYVDHKANRGKEANIN